MKITVGQLRRLINEEGGSSQHHFNALVAWKEVVDAGLFNLPDAFAQALRSARTPQQKQALQSILRQVQDGIHSLIGVADDIRDLRRSMR